jgi:hypothetical protein
MVTTLLANSMIDFLLTSAKPKDVLDFKLPAPLQERASILLERNREGLLTEEEREELSQFVFLEHIFRVAKSRARMQLAVAA